MAVVKHELFQSPAGQFYIVKATTLGEYSLHRVHAEYVRRYHRKYEAVKAIESGMADVEPND